jgi:hypothetical protein
VAVPVYAASRTPAADESPGREWRVSRALTVAAGVLSIVGGLAWAAKLIGRFLD